MPWCPKCLVEYREEFIQCPNCGSQLVEKLDDILDEAKSKRDSLEEEEDISDFEKNGLQVIKKLLIKWEILKPDSHVEEIPSVEKPIDYEKHIEEVLLKTFTNEVEFTYVTSLLDENGIKYRKMEEGVGEYLHIYFGLKYSYMGISIYVETEHFERAMQILQSYELEILINKEEVVINEDDELVNNEKFDKILRTFIISKKIMLFFIYLYLIFNFLLILTLVVIIFKLWLKIIWQ